jgi:phosphoribosyl 1,2-cyclic phosphodiesterase
VIAISLQSGSCGNCLYVETNGVKLLFDAGISSIEAARRLADYGRDIRDVNGLIISHDHADHVRHAGVYHRRFGLPVFITPRTLSRAAQCHRLGKLNDVHYFMSGGSIRFGNVSVRTIPCPHDSVDSSAFVVSHNGKSLGIFTDIGHVFQDLLHLVASLDAVFIESNYDDEMLEKGPYHALLKKRIRGPEGHLSNRESAVLLQAGKRLQWACLAHLSENNNSPGKALQTHRQFVENDLTLYTASRSKPTGILSVQ